MHVFTEHTSRSSTERGAFAGGEHCRWLWSELAGILRRDHPPLLLLPLSVRLRSCPHWSNVHSLPVCLRCMWGTPPDRCPHPRAAVQRYGLLDNIRHWLCPTLLWGRVRASEQMVSIWAPVVCILPGCLAVHRRCLVEVYWAVVSRATSPTRICASR